MTRAFFLIFLFSVSVRIFAAEETSTTTGNESRTDSKGDSKQEVPPNLQKAIDNLKLPGVEINLRQWCVDVDSRVCLTRGMLELIACTKGTKEHESIFAVDAKPSHIHTALLLLSARAGNPASQQIIEEGVRRIVSIPPSGSPVQVFVVQKDTAGQEIERPVSDFIVEAEEQRIGGKNQPEKAFPTHTFLFAGSVLIGEGTGPRHYLCDTSGHVLSIATFGDELLCLPGIHDSANGALVWSANGEKLPKVGTIVTLRLRPDVKKEVPAALPPLNP